MRYLGKAECRYHNKTHNGYKVFNLRLNEHELDTIAFLIDLHDSRKTMLSENGKYLQENLRGLRRGIKEVKKALENEEL